jgi:hypothetical protein
VLGDSTTLFRLPTQTLTLCSSSAFHEMEHPVVCPQCRALKPQGRIGITDYREGEGGLGPIDQRVPPNVVIWLRLPG